ncbi:MAG: peptidoglycan DD-metalloendopeptidase family protein [Desulfomicrobium escambiense]|nr:peptidoglycan DD-metalloendopeptidase family protein [Desulfomicrobium escambiense]
MAGIEGAVREQQAAMEAERQTLAALLRSVEEERSVHESMLAELKARESNLRGMLASLAREEEETLKSAEGAVDFASRPAACWACSGPITSIRQKVHPKFGTVVMQNGIEIGAAAGAPVRAVAPGTVRFADWFRGYGNLVIIDHGGSWYIALCPPGGRPGRRRPVGGQGQDDRVGGRYRVDDRRQFRC